MFPKLSALFLIATASFLGSSSVSADTAIVNEKGAISEGAYKYFYDSSIPNACETVLLIGVGTAMGVEDYDNLATAISTGQPITTVISDHNPRFFVKLSERKFEKYYNAMVPSLQSIIPACKDVKYPKILVGAHSASGQASIKALPKLKPQPDGYIGLDPFKINEKRMKIDPSIPTLDWGFSKTTCQVKVEQAAKPAYEISSPKHRVFYRVDNPKVGGFFGRPAIAHCVFTDKGCAVVCGLRSGGTWVISAVADSIHKFVAIVKGGGSIVKSAFELDAVKEGKVELFVNGDDPDAKSDEL